MNIFTHTVSYDGKKCLQCGKELPPMAEGKTPLTPGERVGVIEPRTVAPTTYRIGQKDSNPQCIPDLP